MKLPALMIGLFAILALRLLAATEPSRKETAPVITLEQAYDLAMATDQSIQIAYWEARKANLLPWSALAKSLGPKISANGGLTHNETTNRSVGGPVLGTRIDGGSLGVTAIQPLIDATVFPAYKYGKLSVRSTRLQHQFTVRGVLFSVAKAYYEVLTQQKIVEENRLALELNNKQLDYARQREAVGEVTRADELRARVAVEGSRKTLIESENTLLADRNVLANLLGRSDDNFSLVQPKDYAPRSEPFETLLARAFEHREDLRVAQLAIAQDQQLHNEVVGQYFPTVSARWDGGLSESHSALDKSQDQWVAGISVDVPIFSGGQRELDLISTREKVTQTRLEREKLAKQIQEDTKVAWLVCRSLSQTIKALTIQVEAAEQSYKDLDNQYRAGTATSLDVLSALNDLNASRRDLTVQTYAYQVALRNLEQVSGVFEQKRIEGIKIR